MQAAEDRLSVAQLEIRNKLNGLSIADVTGAKARAQVDFLLAPTRAGSIQPECDRPSRDSWPIEC
jgi:hypothetical protein